MEIPLTWYLTLSAVLFSIGVMGVLFRSNLIVILMSIELMLNAVNLTLIAFGQFMGDLAGQILVFFVISVAAAEAAVGLAIVIAIFRNKLTVDVNDIKLFRH
ncbi:MAG: NADH-quinone oxidoreductase subunit NuoK [Bacteroidetes bacterium]|nr:NADH-quinone oxidoreductase subunit NuoK [Bacteroidota bacterium]